MAYWRSINGISSPMTIRDFKGVYYPEDKGFNLPENLFTEMVNFTPEYPSITTRDGYTVVGTFGTKVLGLGAWKDQELHAVFNDGSWRRMNNDGTWTSLATGLNTSAEWAFCNYQGNLSEINLIGANGVDNVKRYNGTTVQNLSGAPSNAKYIRTQSNRLYCAVGNVIKFSALRKADDWTTVDDAGEIVHETNDGEEIVGLNAGNGHVTIYKSSSTYELYGKGPTSYSLESVATDIGATGNKAISVHDDIASFVSRDGLYQYSGGLRPSKSYSEPVRQLIRRINKSQMSKCVVGSDGNCIYFGVPIDSSTENNRIIRYEPHTKTWVTWDGISVTQMIRIGSTMYFGDAQGRVLRLGGSTDNGNPITAMAITKPFTTNSIARKQHWFKLWVVASVTTGSTLKVYVSKKTSGEDWILANSLTASSDIQYKELLVPTNSIADANAVRIKIVGTGKVTIHEISRQFRELPMRR